LRFLLIILLYLNAHPTALLGQDLEDVAPPTQSSLRSSPAQDGMVEEPDILAITQSTTDSIDKSQIESRAADTYRKEEYLNELLRQTYYQKTITSDWSKYLNPNSWKKNVLKWRYLTQLKNYITGNNQEIIVIRSNTDPKVEEPIELAVDSIAMSDTLEMDEEAIAQVEIPLPEEEAQQLVEESNTTSNNRQEDNKNEPPIAPVVKKEEVTKAVTNQVAQRAPERDISTTVASPPITQSSPPPPAPSPTPESPKTTTVAPPVLLDRSTVNKDFFSKKGNLPWPVRGGSVTDGFGIRKNAEARGLRRENYGIDMVCPGGSVVSAVYDGTVLMAKRQSPYDFIVTVKHGDFTSAHYYLITTYVKPGDVVRSGQALGQLRTSVAQADFHFEIWNNQDRVNPTLWLKSR